MQNWESLLVQVPLVVAVIWFVLEMDKRNARYAASRDNEWRKFLEEQREAFTASLTQISQVVNELSKDFQKHDKFTEKAVLKMEVRTRPQKRSGTT